MSLERRQLRLALAPNPARRSRCSRCNWLVPSRSHSKKRSRPGDHAFVIRREGLADAAGPGGEYLTPDSPATEAGDKLRLQSTGLDILCSHGLPPGVTPHMSPAKRSKTKKAVRRRVARRPAGAAPGSAARRRTGADAPGQDDAGSGLAPGMQAVNPYLAVANVQASMRFLERALGFAPGVVLPDSGKQPRYAEMRQGETVVMLVRKGDDTAPAGGAAALYTYVTTSTGALARARDAGAGVRRRGGHRVGRSRGGVTDPDGYRWVLATFKKLVPFAEPPAE